MDGKKTITHGGNTFELVDAVPWGYFIWNIGKNMIDGYLPLCRLSSSQPFPGGRSIETDTLKAIKIDGVQTILAAIGWGSETPDEMETYIKKHSANNDHRMEVERMKKALPLMRQIKWR